MKKTILPLLLCLCLVLGGCGDRSVREAETLIDGIGQVTIDSGDAIAKAEYAVSQLTAREKSKITGLDTLDRARVDYDALENRVRAVELCIDGIGQVTVDKEQVIADARASFEALDASLRERVQNAGDLERAEDEFLTQLVDAAQAAIDAIGQVTIDKEQVIADAKKAIAEARDAFAEARAELAEMFREAEAAAANAPEAGSNGAGSNDAADARQAFFDAWAAFAERIEAFRAANEKSE